MLILPNLAQPFSGEIFLYVSKSINKLLKLSAKNETSIIIIIVRSHMRLDDILEANPTKLSSIKFTRKNSRWREKKQKTGIKGLKK